MYPRSYLANLKWKSNLKWKCLSEVFIKVGVGIEFKAQGDRWIFLFSFTLPRALSLLHQKDNHFIIIENKLCNTCNWKQVVCHLILFASNSGTKRLSTLSSFFLRWLFNNISIHLLWKKLRNKVSYRGSENIEWICLLSFFAF